MFFKRLFCSNKVLFPSVFVLLLYCWNRLPIPFTKIIVPKGHIEYRVLGLYYFGTASFCCWDLSVLLWTKTSSVNHLGDVFSSILSQSSGGSLVLKKRRPLPNQLSKQGLSAILTPATCSLVACMKNLDPNQSVWSSNWFLSHTSVESWRNYFVLIKSSQSSHVFVFCSSSKWATHLKSPFLSMHCSTRALLTNQKQPVNRLATGLQPNKASEKKIKNNLKKTGRLNKSKPWNKTKKG